MVFERIVAKGFAFSLIAAGGFWIYLMPAAQNAQAQEYASKQRTNAAVGYYARSRAMLVEALEEFEQGRKYARPDLLVDPEEWRLTVISLTEQLNRLIDPKPLVTRDGVVFQANPRMVRREADRLPGVPDGAQDSNIYGEQERMKEIQESRARMYEPGLAQKGKKGLKKTKKAAQKPPVVEETAAQQEQPEEPAEASAAPQEPAQPAGESQAAAKAEKPKSLMEAPKQQGAEFESLVRERLKSIEGAAGQPEKQEANTEAAKNEPAEGESEDFE